MQKFNQRDLFLSVILVGSLALALLVTTQTAPNPTASEPPHHSILDDTDRIELASAQVYAKQQFRPSCMEQRHTIVRSINPIDFSPSVFELRVCIV